MEEENYNKLIIGLLIAAVFIIGFNFYQMSQLKTSLMKGSVITGSAVKTDSSNSQINLDSLPAIIPRGVPAIYGKELKISFDDVNINDPESTENTIRTLALLDQEITLSSEENIRYINILYKKENGISCEYCCGARAIIFENGQPACGCAHSYAMRGLAKYLITKHGKEYTDDQILEEVGKWKTLFFPTQTQLKAKLLESQGIELNYINLASNKYRGIEKVAAGSASGAMVGGC